MKFKKLIPVVLAMMLAAPSFAATSQTDDMTFTIDDVFEMTKNSSVLEPTAVTVNYSAETPSIALSPTLGFGYKVVTNMHSTAVKLTATASASDGGGTANALNGATTSSPIIAFTNNTHLPTASAVANAIGTADAASNPNVIAFTMTPHIEAVSGSGAEAPAASWISESNYIKYTFHYGIYNFDYDTIGGSARANTFSTHDEAGLYKATVALTKINP